MRKQPMPCGTKAAYQRHRRNGETPCEPCAQAAREYQLRYRGKQAPVPRPTRTPCGTYAGFRRHERASDVPCNACREAARTYWREKQNRYNAEQRYAKRPQSSRYRPTERPSRTVECPVCSVSFTTTVPNRVYCSVFCRYKRRHPMTRLLSVDHQVLPAPRRRGHRWRQLRLAVLADEPNCHICKRYIDLDLPWPDPMSATVDHVVPVAAGGAAWDRENLRAAHFICNSTKGASVGNADWLML